MDKFDAIIAKLEKRELSKDEFTSCLNRLDKCHDVEVDADLLRFYGLPIAEDEESVYLETLKQSFKDETYCVVDIETNGNSPIKNQIIEIGAVKYKHGEVLDRFESYVYADYIPPAIEKLTNISPADLKHAPSLKKVLYDFRLFLGTSVFVAHNVKFDYNFISTSLKTVGIDELLNRRICTVDLSRKTIKSERHGLAYLREFLNIDTGEHHRAYSDALSAAKVLESCFKNIPEEVETTEDLIKFAMFTPKKKKKPKNDQRRTSN